MPDSPVQYGGAGLDLSPRISRTAAVVASPAAAAETIVASATVEGNPFIAEGVLLLARVAYTVGTAGVSGNVRIRRTNVTGTIISASGALTVAATELFAPTVIGFDTGPTLPGQVYVVTLTVGSASAESAVSAVDLVALAI